MGWPPDPPEYDYPDGVDMSDPAEKTESGITIEVKSYALDNVREAAAARIAESLHSAVEKMVEQRLDAILDDVWRSSLETKAQAAIDDYLTKPRQKTNTYGEPLAGLVEVFADRIPKIVQEYMAVRVDKNGSADYGYRGNDKSYPTRLEYMLKTLVIEELKKETEKAAKDVTEKARALVANHVGRFISEQMVPAIEVQK